MAYPCSHRSSTARGCSTWRLLPVLASKPLPLQLREGLGDGALADACELRNLQDPPIQQRGLGEDREEHLVTGGSPAAPGGPRPRRLPPLDHGDVPVPQTDVAVPLEVDEIGSSTRKMAADDRGDVGREEDPVRGALSSLARRQELVHDRIRQVRPLGLDQTAVVPFRRGQDERGIGARAFRPFLHPDVQHEWKLAQEPEVRVKAQDVAHFLFSMTSITNGIKL